MRPGEEAAGEEVVRRLALCGQHIAGVEVAGVGVGVGVGEHLAAQLGQGRAAGVVRGHDDVGLVAWLTAPERHRHQRHLVLVAHEGIATDPREIELVRAHEVDDLAVAAALHEDDRAPELALEPLPPLTHEAHLVVEEDRGQADANGHGLRARRKSLQQYRCADRAQKAPPRRVFEVALGGRRAGGGIPVHLPMIGIVAIPCQPVPAGRYGGVTVCAAAIGADVTPP